MFSPVKATYLASILILAPLTARAEGIHSLEKGFYLPKDVGCSGIGGAAEIYFDGSNISGHYQLCKTSKTDKKDTYRSECIEAQGLDQPKLSNIESDPDKTTVEQRIEIKSKTSFITNNTIYNHCRS